VSTQRDDERISFAGAVAVLRERCHAGHEYWTYGYVAVGGGRTIRMAYPRAGERLTDDEAFERLTERETIETAEAYLEASGSYRPSHHDDYHGGMKNPRAGGVRTRGF
jgi:hypothetical protein